MRVGGRFFAESGAALAGSLLAVVTLARPDWIELAFGVDPDAGSGLTEWALVAALALIAVTCAALAWRDWRKARGAVSEASGEVNHG